MSTSHSDLLDLYRRWRHATRQGERFARICEDLEEAMDTPWPLVCMPSYAGGGIVEGLYRIEQDERLLDIDRERLTAEYREKWAVYQAAKEACGAEAAHDESVRWEREASTLAAQIMTTPARTLEEMHAKTAVGLRFADAKASCEDPDGALQSLRCDIGRALRGQRRGRNGADGSPVEQRVADLVRLRDEFERLWEADEDSAETSACGFRVDAAVQAIYGAPIDTMADAAAVLRGVLVHGAEEMNRSDIPTLERLSAFLDAQAARDSAAAHPAVPELMRLSALMGFGPGAEAGPAGQEVAGLLELERLHHEVDQRYQALPDDPPDEVWQPVYQELLDLENRITETPITTMAGALVKLRLALGPVGTGAGENPDRCLHGACATLEAVAVQAGYSPPWTKQQGSGQ
ncbi:hypothetical protein [Azospirillum rugosum]|uniref:Uncharacterized protein n=1 Tax=Azospirillum rugosum TaxID=416170 RepID=A0ABS4SG10_9PROT|nr:hypothetical protein [Azospirillum rugosum]MBP2291023.1 hypothetical protein [Azospirillum rugosum]MDQ0524913.1 hypothetical protein [Azospirillum rugosum]